MVDEPENLVLELLRGIRADMATKAELAEVKADLAELRTELKGDINSLRADVASDLLAMQAKAEADHKATREQIVGLRRAVFEYHSSVIGTDQRTRSTPAAGGEASRSASCRRRLRHGDLSCLDARIAALAK
jgi:hypothetical protein